MKKYFVIFLSIILPIVIVLFYYFYDENNKEFSSQCSFHQITGLQCPGCGGQRAFHFLLHGEILKSLRYNSLLWITIPILVYLYYSIVQAYGLNNKKYINHPFWGTRFVIIMFILLVVFFVIRNIPYYPFIYLSPPVQ